MLEGVFVLNTKEEKQVENFLTMAVELSSELRERVRCNRSRCVILERDNYLVGLEAQIQNYLKGKQS